MQKTVQPFGFQFLTSVSMPTPPVQARDGIQGIDNATLDMLASYGNTLTFTPGPDNSFDDRKRMIEDDDLVRYLRRPHFFMQ